jgi:GNAT superfamily N-acetyltransferase
MRISVEAVRRRASTARELYRQGGVQAVIFHALRILGYHRYVLFDAPLHVVEPVPAARVPLTFGFVGPGELDDLVAFRQELGRETFAERLTRGERCFAAWFEGRIVSTLWLHTFDVPLSEIGFVLKVPHSAIYVGDGFTAPELRGLGIAAATNRAAKSVLAEEGFQRWVFYVLAGNHLGLANALRTKPPITARVAALKLGPLPAIRVPFLPRGFPRTG